MADYYLNQPQRPIELNPAHKGRFTEWCLRHGFRNVQEGARHVLANRDKYPADVVKMANFAHNSKQWGKGRSIHHGSENESDHTMRSDREDAADETDPNEEDDSQEGDRA